MQYANEGPLMEDVVQPGLEWWFDPHTPGKPIWAVIRVNDWGEISVLDIDGRLHLFDDLEKARMWLREDEYQAFTDLDRQQQIDDQLSASNYPPDTGYNADLLPWMRQQAGCDNPR
ncbi:MAG: hypothetical protein OQK12_13965 [Motiliproteus sp.]|nr:hypothetical protein [Motiliproteus sp.]MCW9053895.1 hypothetical protein [Motiliproteus sp.]